MECEEFRELASSYVKHQLSQEKIQEVEEHLCVCELCRNYLGKILDSSERSTEKTEEEIKKNELFIYIILTIAFLLFIFLLYLLLSYKP